MNTTSMLFTLAGARLFGPAALTLLLTLATEAGAAPRAIEGVVNLNTATAAELQLLPGVGPARAAQIIEHRKARPFKTVDELVRIKGVGRKTLVKLRPHLTVTGPTTASAGAGRPAATPEAGCQCACPACPGGG